MAEWTIGELAERAGITPRTLRHYHQIGLLVPDRTGNNGYRYYGSVAAARLQRILLLRDTGLSLTEITTALNNESDYDIEIKALELQLIQLRQNQEALAQRISAVEHTLEMRRAGRQPRMDLVLEGFNDRYEDEVTQRWGYDAFKQSNQWWHAKSVKQQRQFQASAEELLARWGELYADGLSLNDISVQEHVAVHIDWFSRIPGTPFYIGDETKTGVMIRGIADLYVTNPDFHVAFGSSEAAAFAAKALRHYADKHCSK